MFAILNVNPSLIAQETPSWFKLGAFQYIRIGKHIFEKDGSYLGDYVEATKQIDTTADEPEGLEEIARAWATKHPLGQKPS